MPFDGVAMRAVAVELNETIVGGRVEKVLQPERDEIHLLIRNNYKNHRLLVSASANHARVHLTQHSKQNPDRAPMFCMLLRKHLIGGKVLSVTQLGMERVLDIRFGVIDELGLTGELILHVEVMGRHSNAVLVQPDGTIVDSLKRVTEEKSRVREVLPGIPYEYPPVQGKKDPLVLDAHELLHLLAASCEKPLWQTLCDNLTGLAQATAKELLAASGLNPVLASCEFSDVNLRDGADALAIKFSAIKNGRFTPVALMRDGETIDFLPFRSVLAFEQREHSSISEAAEAFYADRDRKERLKQSSAAMTQALNAALNRAKKKHEKQGEDLLKSENMEMWRLKGELLTANLHAVQRGQKSVEVLNYYSEEGETLAIELDPTLSPSDNAQQYYKRYTKAKTAQEKLTIQLEATTQEIAYLESQLSNIELSMTEGDLDEIRAELAEQGYLKEAAARSRKKITPSKPRHYRSSDGYDIFVGRNNTQNDYLTTKLAYNDDVWMHTKQIPGSHIIIKAKAGAVSDEALHTGALLAAYYSKARESSGVPVDYTQKRNVKKPAGAKPGFVIYLTNRTLTLTPSEEMIQKIELISE